jgi:putative methionine-R-sulfoxide reductase with GAF domain
MTLAMTQPAPEFTDGDVLSLEVDLAEVTAEMPALSRVDFAAEPVRAGDGSADRGVAPDASAQALGETHLSLLRQAAQVLRAGVDPNEMLRALINDIREPLAVDAYFSFMVNESGDGLALASCAGIGDEDAKSLERLEFGAGICGNVALERASIAAAEIQSSSDRRVQLVKSYGMRSYACNPLLSGERLIGTLSFASRTRDEFCAQDLEFFRSVAHAVAIAYERVRLLGQLAVIERELDEMGRPLPDTLLASAIAQAEAGAGTAPVGAVLAHAVSAEGAFVEAALTGAAPAEAAFVEAALTGTVRAEGAFVEAALTGAVPAEGAFAEAGLTGTVPAKAAPAEVAPGAPALGEAIVEAASTDTETIVRGLSSAEAEIFESALLDAASFETLAAHALPVEPEAVTAVADALSFATATRVEDVRAEAPLARIALADAAVAGGMPALSAPEMAEPIDGQTPVAELASADTQVASTAAAQVVAAIETAAVVEGQVTIEAHAAAEALALAGVPATAATPFAIEVPAVVEAPSLVAVPAPVEASSAVEVAAAVKASAAMDPAAAVEASAAVGPLTALAPPAFDESPQAVITPTAVAESVAPESAVEEDIASTAAGAVEESIASAAASAATSHEQPSRDEVLALALAATDAPTLEVLALALTVEDPPHHDEAAVESEGFTIEMRALEFAAANAPTVEVPALDLSHEIAALDVRPFDPAGDKPVVANPFGVVEIPTEGHVDARHASELSDDEITLEVPALALHAFELPRSTPAADDDIEFVYVPPS